MNKISLMSILVLMGIMLTGLAVIGTNNPYITRNLVPGGSPFLPYSSASVTPPGNTAYSHQVFPQYHLETAATPSSNSTSTSTITITSSTTMSSNDGDYNSSSGNSTSSAQNGSPQPPSSDSGNGHYHHSKH